MQCELRILRMQLLQMPLCMHALNETKMMGKVLLYMYVHNSCCAAITMMLNCHPTWSGTKHTSHQRCMPKSHSACKLIGEHVLDAYSVYANDQPLKVCYTWTCALPNSFDLTVYPKPVVCLQIIGHTRPLSKSISAVVENSHSATRQMILFHDCATGWAKLTFR